MFSDPTLLTRQQHTHLHTCVHTYTQTHTYTPAHTNTHPHTYTPEPTHTHTRTHTPTHTHTHTQQHRTLQAPPNLTPPTSQCTTPGRPEPPTCHHHRTQVTLVTPSYPTPQHVLRPLPRLNNHPCRPVPPRPALAPPSHSTYPVPTSRPPVPPPGGTSRWGWGGNSGPHG